MEEPRPFLPPLKTKLPHDCLNYSVPGRFTRHYFDKFQSHRTPSQANALTTLISAHHKHANRLAQGLDSLKQERTDLQQLKTKLTNTVYRQAKLAKARRKLDVQLNQAATLIQRNVRRMIVSCKYAAELAGLRKAIHAGEMAKLDSQLQVCKAVLGEEIAYDSQRRPYFAEGTHVHRLASKLQAMVRVALFRSRLRPRLALLVRYARGSHKIEAARDKKAVARRFAYLKSLCVKKKQQQAGRGNLKGKRGKAGPGKKRSRY